MSNLEPQGAFGNYEAEIAKHIQTNRGINEYAEIYGMSKDQFIQKINGKRILDDGAGGGRLAKEVILLKQQGKLSPETVVYSLDLSYTTKVRQILLHI